MSAMWTSLKSPAYVLPPKGGFPVPSGAGQRPVYFALGAQSALGEPVSPPVAQPVQSATAVQPVQSATGLQAQNGDFVPLPSQQNVIRLVHGDTSPGAVAMVLRDLVLRAGIIGLGLFFAGIRKPEDLIKYGLSGAMAIETFVFLHTLRYNGKAAPDNT